MEVNLIQVFLIVNLIKVNYPFCLLNYEGQLSLLDFFELCPFLLAVIMLKINNCWLVEIYFFLVINLHVQVAHIFIFHRALSLKVLQPLYLYYPF